MITTVKYDNVRGKTGSIDLGNKTLLVGPNGVGKSTIAASINLALLGYLPGYSIKETFANSSSNQMSAGVSIDGKDIVRTWIDGKTLSEKLSINGVEAGRNSSEAMIQMAIGKDPKVIDVCSFFAATSTAKRKMLLGIVADEATQDRIFKAEEKAKAELNSKRENRRVAEKAIERITMSLAVIEKPAGNVSVLRSQLDAAEKARSEMKDKVSEGEANDKAKAQIETQLKSIPGYQEKLGEARASLKMTESRLKELLDEQSKLGEPCIVQVVNGMPKDARVVIEKCIADLSLWVIQCDWVECIIKNLKVLIPSDEVKAKNDLIITEWEVKKDKLKNEIDNCQIDQRKYQGDIERAKAMLDAAKKAEKQIEKIGKGLDEKDKAALLGLDKQISDLKANLRPLEEITVLTREIEKARIEAEKAIQAEEKAKEEIKKVVDEQQKVITTASNLLSERSKTILSDGCLELTDDGKDITVSWSRQGKPNVQRHTLSGGEKCIFDAAAGYSIAPEALIIIEAAEVDSVNLPKLLNHLEKCPGEILVMTCHTDGVKNVPKSWTVIDMCVR